MKLLTDQFIQAAASSGFETGDSQAPDDTSRPYCVVYPLFVADLDGPGYSDPTADGWYDFQVTACGETREQAQALADLLEPIMLAWDYDVVPAYSVQACERSEILPVERDDDVQPPIFYQTQMFQVFVTPSP